MARRIHYERLVVCYHGCDRKTGEQVLLQGRGLCPSHNKYDWLGRGIYFWEHGPERALDWAKERHDRGKIDEPWVLGAYIHLGRRLDLTDTAATAQLRAWHEDLGEAMALAGQVMPENKPAGDGDHDLLLRFLDCAVLNFGLDDMDREEGMTVYQTVRGVFVEGAPAYEGARIMTKTHVQITVRDPDCIIGYFRPAG